MHAETAGKCAAEPAGFAVSIRLMIALMMMLLYLVVSGIFTAASDYIITYSVLHAYNNASHYYSMHFMVFLGNDVICFSRAETQNGLNTN